MTYELVVQCDRTIPKQKRKKMWGRSIRVIDESGLRSLQYFIYKWLDNGVRVNGSSYTLKKTKNQ